MSSHEYDCVVVDSLVLFGDELPVRAVCELDGERWSVASELELDAWLELHAHPQLELPL